jgi:acetyl esterase/lipase
VQTRLNQSYTSTGGASLLYDLFLPDTSEPPPLVICIHGGGWISGEKEGMREIAGILVSRGYAAAAPQYRLAPLHPYPSAVEDICHFRQFAAEQAREWRVDPDRIGVFGNSAGGHLAAMAALFTNDEFAESPIKAVVDVCGISDVTNPRVQHFPISWGFLEQFMNVPFEGHDQVYREASPLFHVKAGAPPFLLVHGEADDIVPVSQSVALAEALKEAGVPVELHCLPHEGHALSYEGWVKTESLMFDFFDRYLQNVHV